MINDELFKKILEDFTEKKVIKITVHWKDSVAEKSTLFKATSMRETDEIVELKLDGLIAVIPKNNIKFMVIEKG